MWFCQQPEPVVVPGGEVADVERDPGEARDLDRPVPRRGTDRRCHAGRAPRWCGRAGRPRASRRAPGWRVARRWRRRRPPTPARPPASAPSDRLRRSPPHARSFRSLCAAVGIMPSSAGRRRRRSNGERGDGEAHAERPPRSSSPSAGWRSARSCSWGSSITDRFGRTLRAATRSLCGRRRSTRLRSGTRAPEKASVRRESRGGCTRSAAPPRLREAGRAAVHRQGDPPPGGRPGGPGLRSPRVDDRDIVERQLGRAPRAFRGVVVRCPWGRPAITEQDAFDENGEPSRRRSGSLRAGTLAARISRLEAEGGVDRWTRAADEDGELRASLADAHDEQRRIRPELPGGIGGASANRQPEVSPRARGVRARPPGLRARRAHRRRGRTLWPTDAADDLPSGAHADRRGAAGTAPVGGGQQALRRRVEVGASPAERVRGRDRRAAQARRPDVLARAARRCVRQGGRLVADAVADNAAFPAWPRSVTTVQDAAFHAYSRGATDYKP